MAQADGGITDFIAAALLSVAEELKLPLLQIARRPNRAN